MTCIIYITLYTLLQLKLQLQPPLHHITLHYTRLQYTTLQYTTHITHYTTLHFTNYTTPQRQLQLQLQLDYTNYITLQYTTPLHYTTLQLQQQLHYTTPHPAVVGEVTDQVTIATMAATQKTTLQAPFGPSVGRSAIHASHKSPLL